MLNIRLFIIKNTSSSLRRLFVIGWVFLFYQWADASSPAATPSAVPSAPPIASRLKPDLIKKMKEDREVVVHATLDDLHTSEAGESSQQKYSFYAGMEVNAPLKKSRAILTDYRLYAKMIPYIEKTDFDPKTNVLTLEGGIWKFKLKSSVRFEELGEGWLRYEIIQGHFTGMKGDVFFEPSGDHGTRVYFDGAVVGNHWPPKFVIERGAEIVFGFTGKKMRSYIETQDEPQGAGDVGQQQGKTQNLPQPRSHL